MFQAAIIIGSIVSMIVGLRLLGRRVYCACGSWNPWSSDVTGCHQSQHFSDAYSGTHILHGILLYPIAYLLNVPAEYRLSVVCVAEAAWEIAENTSFMIRFYRKNTISRNYFGDTVLNSIGDLACCLIGAVIAASSPIWLSVVLLVGIEVLLLVEIGDSLTVNLWKGVKATIAWATRWHEG